MYICLYIRTQLDICTVSCHGDAGEMPGKGGVVMYKDSQLDKKLVMHIIIYVHISYTYVRYKSK